MNDDKWGEIIDNIEEKFDVVDSGKETLENIPDAFIEFIVFDSPMGKLRLERKTSPRVLDTKALGAQKRTMGVGVEFVYSKDEFVKTLKAYKEEDGEWVPFEAEGLI